VIVADTSAVVALMNARDRHHAALADLYREHPSHWRLPWCILAEVDYLLTMRAGERARTAFSSDLASGRYVVDWGLDEDLARAHELSGRYRDLKLGLVDACVMALAERVEAEAIATLDLRHFGAVKLRGSPKLLPRDFDSVRER
jgi:hypothetical protein